MDSKVYWDNRYKNGGNSGAGSYGDMLNRKLDWLKKLEGIKTIYELGCGDFNFGWRLLQFFPDATYIGTDMSETIIERNKQIAPKHTFTTNKVIIPSDLVLCVDVLFHVLDEKELEDILNGLEKAWTKYLVITAYERDEEMTNHVRIRKFDYKRFGEPIVREICEEEGSLYFYIWKK